MTLKKLKNHYYILRHGISKANEAGVIVSRPENGTLPEWGLSEAGITDTRQKLAPSVLDKAGQSFSVADTIVISSDFSRALETAVIFCELSQLEQPQVDIRLRERNFGKLELESHENYQKVWEIDKQTENTRAFDCESTRQVADRLGNLLEECEAKYKDKKIVLVAHGDPSQIIQTVVQGLRPNQHRELPHMGNAELRLIN